MQSFFNKSNCLPGSTGIALTRNVSNLVPTGRNGNSAYQALVGECGQVIFMLIPIQFQFFVKKETGIRCAPYAGFF